MKKVLFVLFLLCGVIGSASAQTSTVEKYDSLSKYIKADNLSKYINQNIYISNSNLVRSVRFINFYASLGGKKYSPYGGTGKLNNPDSLCGRILRINSIGVYNNNKYIQLVDDSRKNKESLFYIFEKDDYKPLELILYGYFIKMKELLLNKTFYRVNDVFNTPLKCDSVYIKDGPMETEVKAKFNNGHIEDASPEIVKRSNDYLRDKKETEERDKMRQKEMEEDEKIAQKEMVQRKLAIKKYGNVRIGMRRDIVFKVCGDPDKINTTITRYGKSEQFIYEDKLYIYIDNGRVSAIQDYQ